MTTLLLLILMPDDKLKTKNKTRARAREMAQHLRALAALQRTGFSSQNLYARTHLPVAPVPGELTPSRRHMGAKHQSSLKKKKPKNTFVKM